VYIGGGT
jgi:hypothetical protein